MFKWAMFLNLDFFKGILLVLYGMECKRVENFEFRNTFEDSLTDLVKPK